MVVVTDTSPINYLLLTGYVDVLPVLHGEVVIPFSNTGQILPLPPWRGKVGMGGSCSGSVVGDCSALSPPPSPSPVKGIGAKLRG